MWSVSYNILFWKDSYSHFTIWIWFTEEINHVWLPSNSEHVITCMSDCSMRFGLVIALIEHLQTVTTSNYSAIPNWHSAIHHGTDLSLLNLLCVHRLSDNGFQQCPLPPCSRCYRLATVPHLSTLNSTRLHSTNKTQLGRWNDIASERTEQ
jgi:hypothetical protein